MAAPTRQGRDVTALVADDLVAVLDYLSRVCTAADDDGNLHYLWDKAGELERAAQRLHRHLSVSRRGTPDDSIQLNPARLRELVTRNGRHYRAGRALYPEGGSLEEAGRRQALEAAAISLELGHAFHDDGSELQGLSHEQTQAVATWLRQRAGATS